MQNIINTTSDMQIDPQDEIYKIATDKDNFDWKSFLYKLINKEGMDPFDVDIQLLTKKYLQALKELKTIDFNISGKFLTIAVFLLKTKAERLIEKDIRGIEEKIAQVQQMPTDDIINEIEALEELDYEIDTTQNEKEKYSLKIRNPIARKRKVNIFDLIKTLEKTIEQSNRRKTNFLIKNAIIDYEGPMYEKKSKDLKSLINDIYEMILSEFKNKSGHLNFENLVEDSKSKMEVIEKFIPLLHLHNQSKIELRQRCHFGDIQIFSINNINED